MSSIETSLAGEGFGGALRAWRRARGLSQLDLALAADASPRHLSFLETNRAKPSRDMVLTLADAMVLPRAACNALLTAAGYAALFPVTPLDAAALEPLRAVLDEMMRKHAPYPALLCDRRWTLLDATPSARIMLNAFQDEGAGELNLVRLLIGPRAEHGIVNYAEVLHDMAGRIRLEALEAGADPLLAELTQDLEKAISRFPSLGATPRRPLAPLVLRGPAGDLSFLSTIVHFGTSEDVTVRDLRLELLFPADDATRAAMAALG